MALLPNAGEGFTELPASEALAFLHDPDNSAGDKVTADLFAKLAACVENGWVALTRNSEGNQIQVGIVPGHLKDAEKLVPGIGRIVRGEYVRERHIDVTVQAMDGSKLLGLLASPAAALEYVVSSDGAFEGFRAWMDANGVLKEIYKGEPVGQLSDPESWKEALGELRDFCATLLRNAHAHCGCGQQH